jgi:hypothetical protein
MKGILWAYLRRDAAEHAEGRGHGVAAALDGQLHDVLAVEVDRVLGEARPGGVFDALVDGQDRHVAGAGKASVPEQRLERTEHLRAAVAGTPDSVDEVGPRQMEQRLVDLRLVPQERVGVGSEELLKCANGLQRLF